jgi:hypothetical protein
LNDDTEGQTQLGGEGSSKVENKEENFKGDSENNDEIDVKDNENNEEGSSKVENKEEEEETLYEQEEQEQSLTPSHKKKTKSTFTQCLLPAPSSSSLCIQ